MYSVLIFRFVYQADNAVAVIIGVMITSLILVVLLGALRFGKKRRASSRLPSPQAADSPVKMVGSILTTLKQFLLLQHAGVCYCLNNACFLDSFVRKWLV